jgi:hypothetical protein
MANYCGQFGTMWFYTKDNKNRLGPYNFQQMQQLAATGYLTPTDMVQQPTGAWVAAGSIPALVGMLPQIQQPPSPPTNLSKKVEITYLKTWDATVTSTRAVLHHVTYAMVNITSVRKTRIEPNQSLGMLAIVFGIILFAWGMATSNPTAMTLGAVVFVLGCGILMILKPSFAVTIGSAGGEKHALVGKAQKDIDCIVDAVSQAIIERG